MRTNTIEMRRKRADLVNQAGAILDRARRDRRDLTGEERKDFDRLHDEAEGILARVERMERQEATEADLARIERGDRDETRHVNGRAGKGIELPEDSMLGPDETFRDRAVRQYGPDDARFGAVLKAGLGHRVPDLRESERRALSSTQGSAGGFMVGAVTSAQILDRLRPRSVVLELGGGRGLLPDNVGGEWFYPKLESEPTPYFTGENPSLGEADPTFSADRIEPRILTHDVIKIPRKLLEQSPVDVVERFIIRAMASAFATEIDRASLFGTGSAQEPLGLVNRSGFNVHSMGVNGAAIDSYDPFIDAIKLIEDDNGPMPTGAAMAPRTAATLAKLKETDTDAPLDLPRKIRDLRMLTSTQIPTDEEHGSATDASRIIIGGWSDMAVMFQGNIRVLTLVERYADKLQVGLVSYVYVDVKVDYPEAFASVSGIIP